MRLFIRLLNGVPVDHPIVEDNMRMAFPNIDLNNLPAEFANFIRIPQPSLDVMPVGPYQQAVVKYVLNTDGKTYQDQWYVRNLSDEEKAEKIAFLKSQPPSKLFVFNEETCEWENPIPIPAEDGVWQWDYENDIWVNLLSTDHLINSVDFT